MGSHFFYEENGWGQRFSGGYVSPFHLVTWVPFCGVLVFWFGCLVWVCCLWLFYGTQVFCNHCMSSSHTRESLTDKGLRARSASAQKKRRNPPSFLMHRRWLDSGMVFSSLIIHSIAEANLFWNLYWFNVFPWVWPLKLKCFCLFSRLWICPVSCRISWLKRTARDTCPSSSQTKNSSK